MPFDFTAAGTSAATFLSVAALTAADLLLLLPQPASSTSANRATIQTVVRRALTNIELTSSKRSRVTEAGTAYVHAPGAAAASQRMSRSGPAQERASFTETGLLAPSPGRGFSLHHVSVRGLNRIVPLNE